MSTTNSQGRMVDEISKYVDGGDSRQTTINWDNLLKQINDGYENAEGLVHGVQKDAIQNGWDARKNRKGKGWKFTFELIETPSVTFFTMTDEATTGLTGRILKIEELEEHLPEEEKWGRFENMAFQKDPSNQLGTLGARGRGKFIFVGASNEKAILYDTLRDDGIYRFGARYLRTTKTPVTSTDGEPGKKIIKELTKNLIEPLSVVGTRIIIVNPKKDLIDDVINGNFLKYINETWWEIILKYDAKICLKYRGNEFYAKIPDEFALLEHDDDEHIILIKEKYPIDKRTYKIKIKKLYIASAKNIEIPNHLQGIAIQRGGMKICSIISRYLPPKMAHSLYGYITLEEESEKELKEYESPEHYSFSKNKAYPTTLRNHIESEIADFARQKLGYGTDERARKRELARNAEKKAVTAINEIASTLGFQGVGFGRKKNTTSHESGSIKPLRIQMFELVYPRENDLRVNYEETVKNIGCIIINDAAIDMKVNLKIFLRDSENEKKCYFDENILISANSKTENFGPFEQLMDRSFLPGEYVITCRLVSLMENDIGERIDIKKRKFYFEVEPPKFGLFEQCIPMEFPAEIQNNMADIVLGAQGGYILQYNTVHPEYESIQESEDDLTFYLYRLLTLALCKIDIDDDSQKLFNSDDYDVPSNIITKTLKTMGEFSSYYFNKIGGN